MRIRYIDQLLINRPDKLMYNSPMKKIIIYTLLTLSSFALPKKVVLGTFLIPGYVQSSTEGEFVEIVKKLKKN